ncbi:MAG: hypothetical protein KDE31_20135, partial [Caldilineaceae bacterium]|nr:hypothetical protein [Caldilineaceae bacterium]
MELILCEHARFSRFAPMSVLKFSVILQRCANFAVAIHSISVAQGRQRCTVEEGCVILLLLTKNLAHIGMR